MTNNQQLRAAAERLRAMEETGSVLAVYGTSFEAARAAYEADLQLMAAFGMRVLAEHRDDGERCTVEWLLSCGWKLWNGADWDSKMYDVWTPMASELSWECRLAFTPSAIYAVRMCDPDADAPEECVSESVKLLGGLCNKTQWVTRGEVRRLCAALAIPLTEPKGATP